MALSLEPFLCTVRADSAIVGYQKTSGMHKVAALVDDRIYFLTDPLTSLLNLLQSLQEYGSLSFFQINLSKSAVLNVTMDKDLVKTLSSMLPLLLGN